jgi:hypothetical protein
MEYLSQLFAFGALVFIVITIVRTRRRIKCLELERNRAYGFKREPVEDYNEAKVVKLVDVCRELEARVQNSASLLESLIDDADKRIETLQNTKQTPEKPTQDNFNHEMYERALSLSNEGKSEEEIGTILNRSKGEVALLLSLGKQTLKDH